MRADGGHRIAIASGAAVGVGGHGSGPGRIAGPVVAHDRAGAETEVTRLRYALRPSARRARTQRTGQYVSDTAERTAGVTGPPPGGQAAGGNGFLRTLRHGAGVFLRQREATVLTVVVALFLYFTIDSPNFFTHATWPTCCPGSRRRTSS